MRPRWQKDRDPALRRGAARRLLASTISVILPIALLAAACGGGEEESGGSTTTGLEPQRGGGIVVGLSGETPSGFKPGSSQFSPSSINVARAIYDPITTIDADGVAKPYLVEAIEHNDDFTEWTFTLREGVKFHNGDELTPEILATHFKSMQLGILTQFALAPIDAVGVVKEAAQVQLDAGEITPEEFEVMSRQVVVFTNTPWSTMPAFFATQPGYLAHPDYTGTAENGFVGTVDEPIGTGPFVFESWQVDKELVVVRNENYWRDGLPYLDKVTFKPMTDPTGRSQALLSGDVDMYHTNNPRELVSLGADGSGAPEGTYAVFDAGAGDEMMIILDTQTGPTSDLRIRRAIALATNRQAIVDGLYDGFFTIASAPFDPDSVWYTDPGWPEPDPDEARRLVEEYEEENGPVKIDFTIVSSAENLELAQAIGEQWSQVGLEMEINGIQEATVATTFLEGSFDALMIAFFPYNDPDEHYHFWDPHNIGGEGEISLNFARYTSDVMKENLDAARETDDTETRVQLYGEVWKDWAENFPFIFLFHQRWAFVVSEKVQGLTDFTFPDGSPAAPMSWGSIYLTTAWVETG